mgnify:CR=1 FL=1
MRDFVSPIITHAYVAELETRIAALERLLAAQEAASEAVADVKPRQSRTAYMRDYMARKRQADREKVSR